MSPAAETEAKKYYKLWTEQDYETPWDDNTPTPPTKDDYDTHPAIET